jgi:hypothetical protein
MVVLYRRRKKAMMSLIEFNRRDGDRYGYN